MIRGQPLSPAGAIVPRLVPMRTQVVDHPLVTHKLTTLRDEATDSPTFRALTEELVALLAYEATRDVRVAPVQVQTPVAVADGVPRDPGTHGCDGPGDVTPHDREARRAEADVGAGDVGQAREQVPGAAVHGGRSHADQDLALPRRRVGQLLHRQLLGPAEALLDDCTHDPTPRCLTL